MACAVDPYFFEHEGSRLGDVGGGNMSSLLIRVQGILGGVGAGEKSDFRVTPRTMADKVWTNVAESWVWGGWREKEEEFPLWRE